MALLGVSLYVDLPILLGVFSLVYSATRHDDWPSIARETLGWIVRVGGFLLVVGIGLFVASSAPDLLARLGFWPTLAAGITIAAACVGLFALVARRTGSQSA